MTITQGDIDGLVAVFTPDGTYSAFGATYTLARFPELVDAAPKGLFMTGTSLVDLDEDDPTPRRAHSRCASSSTPSTTCASATTTTPTCAPTTGGG